MLLSPNGKLVAFYDGKAVVRPAFHAGNHSTKEFTSSDFAEVERLTSDPSSDSIHGFSSSTGDWTLVQIGLHAHASLLRRLTDSLSTAASITDDACRQIHTNAGESCLSV